MFSFRMDTVETFAHLAGRLRYLVNLDTGVLFSLDVRLMPKNKWEQKARLLPAQSSAVKNLDFLIRLESEINTKFATRPPRSFDGASMATREF